MKTKEVYVNGTLIGEAVTWDTVHQLLAEKGVDFVSTPDATEGPEAFFLHGEVEKTFQSNSGIEIAAPGASSGIGERARAIARGLINTQRAGTGTQPDNGMLRLECLSGGYYWISFDGRRVLRGMTIFEADELQSKFIAAIERAGR